MKKTYAFLFFLLLLIAPQLASAQVHYVRTGAAGNNSGSDWANAHPSMPTAFVRGDTYYIADGSYGSVTFNTPVSGASWITIKKATPADHGTSAGWTNSYGDGQAGFTQWNFYTGYYDINGATGGGPSAWTTGHGFAVAISANSANAKLIKVNAHNISNVTIRHTRFSYEYNRNLAYRNSTTGTGQDAFYNASYNGMVNWTFQYCYFEKPGRTHFLTRGNGHSNWVVEYSYLEKSGYGGTQHSEMWSHFKQIDSLETNTVTNVTLRYNYFMDYTSTGGLMFAGGTNIQVYGNVFRWSQNWGATANNGACGNWTGYGNTSWKIYNNTFVNTAGGGSGKLGPIGNNSGTAYNNLWWNSTVGFGGISHNHNWFQGTSAQGESNGEASTASPFVSATDFRLRIPTKGGTSLASPYNSDGMQGVSRGSDGTWDRGAYEYGGGAGLPSKPSAPALTVQ